MPGTNLHQVYEAIGSLTAEVRGLRRDVQEDRKTASDYRAGIRDDMSKLVLRTTQLEADMGSVMRKTDELQQVTDDVKSMRQQAIGAGTAGRWALKIGGWVVSALAGAASVYYALTGRPPP